MKRKGDCTDEIIKQLVKRNLQNDKRKNIMIIVAVSLAAFLISFFGILMFSLEEIQKNQVVDTYEAAYLDLSEHDIEKLRKILEISRVGEYYFPEIEKDKKGFYGSFLYMDEAMLYIARQQVQFEEGKLPEKENEVVVSHDWLKEYRLHKKVGDKIELNTESFCGQYTISGIIKTAGDLKSKTYSFMISKQSLKKCASYVPNQYRAYVHMDKDMSAEEMRMYFNRIANDNGLSKISFNNHYFNYIEKKTSLEQIILFFVFSNIILVSGCIVIQSIFQISIKDKIQNYGKLRTLGATKRQIKKIVKKEGQRLAAVGILAGCICGFMISFAVIPKGFNLYHYVSIATFTVFVCWCMVRFSMYKPIRIAASVSPMEAIRYTKEKNDVYKRTKMKKVTPAFLGKINFYREKKKVFCIMISLSLGGIILLVVSSMLLLQSPNKMARQYFPDGDYKIYIKSDDDHTDLLYHGNPLTKELREELLNVEGVTDVITMRRSASCSFKTKDQLQAVTCDMIGKDNYSEISKALSVGNMPENSYEVILADKYPDLVKGTNIGDQLEMTMGKSSISVKVTGLYDCKKLPVSFGHGDLGLDGPMVYADKKLFQKLLPDIENFDYSWSIVNDKNKNAAIEKKLETIVAANQNTAIDRYELLKERFKKDNFAIYGTFQVLSVFIFLFGVINLVNTTIANQWSRSKEYSSLRSLGITQKQLYIMNLFEGFGYVIFSAGLTLLIGTPTAILICYQVGMISYGKDVPYAFPYIQMSVYIGVVIIIEMILSFWSIKRQKALSLVDELRSC